MQVSNSFDNNVLLPIIPFRRGLNRAKQTSEKAKMRKGGGGELFVIIHEKTTQKRQTVSIAAPRFCKLSTRGVGCSQYQ